MNIPAFITPNQITVFRILFLPLGAWTLYLSKGSDTTWLIISWCVFFILGMSDVVDGNLARSRKQITEFGKFLDPIADKALIATAMISLNLLNLFPWWITIVILTREIGITFFRVAVIKRGVIPANKGGKLKTLFQNFGVGFFMLPLPEWLHWFRNGFIAIAIILTIVTGFYYVRSALRPAQ